jgi:hypothetical protein
MLNFLRIFSKRKPPCSPTYTAGYHGELVYGLGMMGDAILCLRCGREKYEEQWSKEELKRVIDLSEASEELKEDLIPRIQRARNLPFGSTSLLMKEDPSFEKWFKENKGNQSLER